MYRIRLQTAQNVDIEYSVASVGDRILAALVDYIILFAFSMAVIFAAGRLGDTVPGYVYVPLFLPVFFYDLLCETLMNGQSFGKKLLDIRVVKLDGSQPGFGAYLLRWILRPIDITFFSGGVAVVTILINGKGQRVGDIAAGTSVVKLKEPVSLDDTILVELDENYKPLLPEAVDLDDKTVSVVRDVLLFYRNNKNTDAGTGVLEKAAEKLRERLRFVPDMEDEEFLARVLKDYNYYHQNI